MHGSCASRGHWLSSKRQDVSTTPEGRELGDQPTADQRPCLKEQAQKVTPKRQEWQNEGAVKQHKFSLLKNELTEVGENVVIDRVSQVVQEVLERSLLGKRSLSTVTEHSKHSLHTGFMKSVIIEVKREISPSTRFDPEVYVPCMMTYINLILVIVLPGDHSLSP